MRAIIGLLKGGIVGGLLGFGFIQLGNPAALGLLNYLLYGAIGALVGLVAGKPLWRHETFWTPTIKAVFGVGVCVGIYALVVKALGDPSLRLLGLDGRISAFPPLLGALAGIVYGVIVELDDGERRDRSKKQRESEQATL